MPDGTVPSSTEAVRAALSAARASLERQLAAAPTDAAEDALRQVSSALDLLPQQRLPVIADAEWVDAIDAPSASGPSDPTPSSAPPLDVDDLTAIRGIDKTLADRLAAIGIRRFAQIALWQPDDVRVIADAMGLGRRFLAMGIVEQAAEHVRRATERQQGDAAPATKDQPVRRNDAVAVWRPSVAATTTPMVPIESAQRWRPLEGEQLRLAAETVRRRLPQNRLVTLAHLVPPLAQPIFVATDDGTSPEMPRWRTGVLVPFVEAPTPDLTRFGPHARPADQVATLPRPPRTIVVSAPTLDTFGAQRPAPSPNSPADVSGAEHRIAGLEDAVATFSTALREPAEAILPPDEATATVEAPSPRVALPPAHAAAPISATPSNHEEADVRIIARAPRPGRSDLLAPLPALPLKPRQGAAPLNGAAEAQRLNYHQVQEAAVIIVRRNGTSAPAPMAPAAAGPLQRFLRAISRRRAAL